MIWITTFKNATGRHSHARIFGNNANPSIIAAYINKINPNQLSQLSLLAAFLSSESTVPSPVPAPQSLFKHNGLDTLGNDDGNPSFKKGSHCVSKESQDYYFF